MTTEVFRPDGEDQSYFTLDPRSQRATEGSSPISPHTKPKKKPPLSQRRSHLGTYSRSQSDQEHTQAKVRIPSVTAHGSSRRPHALRRPESAPKTHDNSIRQSRDDDSQSSATSLVSRQQGRNLGSSSSYSSRPAEPGHHWRRTQSGGVWYQCEQSSGRCSKKSSRGSAGRFKIWTGRADDSGVNTSQVAERSVSHSPPVEHHISVDAGPPDDNVEQGNKPTSERYSRDRGKARDILISPLTYLRKLSIRTKSHNIDIELPSTASPQASKLSMSPVAHRSAQKHALSKKALSQVSAILQTLTIERASRPLKSAPNRSEIGSDGILPEAKRVSRRVTTLPSPMTMYVKRSSDREESNAISVASSVEDFKLGLTPLVTPGEGATYKIKRSPSADTITYLKVDISVRGETNYLPSEARRIHTPPLPEDSQGGRRRGYFFDYYEPQNAMRENGATQPRKMKAVNQPHKDWYDVELDRLDGDASDIQPLALLASGQIHVGQKFDQEIPEHLPTSPLCPRHPQYWRVVDGKGSQFRGCWMHGFGLDETIGEMRRASESR